jgi:ABC-2 type transport system ATP-binding protein
MNSLVLDSVHKIFRQPGLARSRAETYALNGLSLNVACGEVLALLGPNGSGKSTTLKLISTMLLPDQGVVIVNGCDTRTHAAAVRRQVGFAVASERSFFPRLTARENLNFFAALENIPSRERGVRIEAVLHDTGLQATGAQQVMKFSSGMHQRLGIARALIKRPRVILLDEPTRSLDPAAATHLWTLVQQLSSTGITVLLATHNFSEASAVADRVAILQKGHLLGLRHTSGITTRQLQDYYLQTTGEVEPVVWPEGVPA